MFVSLKFVIPLERRMNIGASGSERRTNIVPPTVSQKARQERRFVGFSVVEFGVISRENFVTNVG